ncbi:MAG TPA: POTRA domain-containing protein [Candidatus Acidoferrales bacterium]|nr:POTRA domain-containing protein [Candidatus Acidoferrales bacterium]
MRVRPFIRRTLVALAAVSLAVALPARARAQAPDVSATGKLASVKVTGSTRFHSDQIVPSTGLSPGATITKDDLQRGADRLAQLGTFATVQYRYATADAGVEAEYQVTDAPAIAVWFDNFPWFTDDELTAELKKTIPLFDGTAPEHGTLLDDISNALGKLLESRSVHSSVSHAIAIAPTTDLRVQQFRADAAALNIAAVEFSDALAQSDRAIHLRLPDIVGQPYSRSLIELFEFEQVRPIYLSHGYLRVKFGPPTARIPAGTSNSGITIAAPIEPGPFYAWNRATWTGNSAFGVLELDTMFPLHEGNAADGVKIEAGWQAVRDAYAHRGYLDVNLTPVPHFDETAKQVSYAVSIAEGPQYRMGKLVLTGLSIEGERRIRAGWNIAPGAVFDKGVYDEFYSSGIKQAFTGLPFNYEKIGRFLQEDPKNATVDVLLDFQ